MTIRDCYDDLTNDEREHVTVKTCGMTVLFEGTWDDLMTTPHADAIVFMQMHEEPERDHVEFIVC